MPPQCVVPNRTDGIRRIAQTRSGLGVHMYSTDSLVWLDSSVGQLKLHDVNSRVGLVWLDIDADQLMINMNITSQHAAAMVWFG